MVSLAEKYENAVPASIVAEICQVCNVNAIDREKEKVEHAGYYILVQVKSLKDRKGEQIVGHEGEMMRFITTQEVNIAERSLVEICGPAMSALGQALEGNCFFIPYSSLQGRFGSDEKVWVFDSIKEHNPNLDPNQTPDFDNLQTDKTERPSVK